jgi:hypothetical protein
MKQFGNLKSLSLLSLGLIAGACSDSPSRRVSGIDAAGAASLQAASGTTGQSATAGTAVSVAPAVIVRDGSGKVMAGVTVDFAITAGGGSVSNSTATTNAQGIATSGNWTLGATPGANALQARVSGLNPLVFTATATAPATTSPTPTGEYSIVVRYVGTASSRQQLAVSNAVARWQSVITRDLADIPLNSAANSCWNGQPAINERIDDMLIFVEFVEIDGAGKVLGEAGPCYVRTDNSLPLLGHLKLDAADLRMMEQYGTLDDVVLHEIGHVLGIGTLWSEKNLLQGKGTEDPGFTGANAVSAYRNIGGTAALVPVENTGGDGTRDGHWRESVFGNELMTGWVGRGSNPLSAMTIASLLDMGYGATSSSASSYTLNNPSGGSRGIQLGHEIMRRPKFEVDRSGKKTKLPH